MLRRPRDAGFTLVELLVAVTLLGLVLPAVAGVLFVAIRTAAASKVRLDESGDLVRAATYFGDDVQGAQGVTTGGTPRCGTDGAAVVEFAGQDFTDDSTLTVTTTVVTYAVRTVTDQAGTRRELHRLSCTAPTATPAYPLIPAGDVTVVRTLSAAAPAVSCVDTGCAAFGRVDLAVAEAGGLTYTLTGRRRTTP